ncbi:holo-ACP synthase [Neomoorella thermoacetica]|uniref:holo-ACP synthase n=1 Tax=Neomoorella thermoacetica TaxID=1525 RepID=UPI0008FBB139|nr:holo-ACP synthase [Moorella thermoacetica]APC09409.1 holo-[acyl-carrier-protein] synthase [Moorella thermoacetica]
MLESGIDIIEISRLERSIKRHPRLLARVFTPAEVAYCLARHRPGASLAARFAAKEAVMKALGIGLGRCSWQDIEITREQGGRPRVILHNRARQLARELGVGEITVSLSHCHAYAAAVALVESSFSEEPLMRGDTLATNNENVV